MTTSYLLISSQYRDRLRYPNPADFIIPFGVLYNTNISNVFGAVNPVAYTIPDYNFCWTNYVSESNPQVYTTFVVSGTALAPILDRSINQELLGIYTTIPPPSFSLRQEVKNCYAVLRGFVLVVNPASPDIQIREIIEYDPTTCQLQLQSPLENFDVSGGPLPAQIRNISQNCPCPSPLLTETESETTDDAVDTVAVDTVTTLYNETPSKNIVVNGPFLDEGSVVYFDFSLYVYNVTLNEIRLVQRYARFLQIFELCECFSCDWSWTDQYWVISRGTPMGYGSFLPFQDFAYYHPSFVDELIPIYAGEGYCVQQSAILLADGIDTGVKVRIVQVSFQGSIQIFEYENVSSFHFRPGQVIVFCVGNNRSAQYSVRSTSLVFLGELKVEDHHSVPHPTDFVGNFLVSVLASPQYTYDIDRDALYLSPNRTIPVRNTPNEPIDLLTSQNRWGATGIRRVSILHNKKRQVLFYVQPYLPQVILRRFDLITQRLRSGEALPPYFRGCFHFLVSQFSFDGVTPLNFQGSSLTQSQMSCFEITVMNLILPNLTINSTQGLLTSAYPYVFLEITNETLPSGHNRSVIYSNNPFSTRATFVCSISDVNNPRTTRFIKINSDGATQTVKFSPFDNLRFRVSLPNGQTFTTEETDTLVPSDPDPRVQISSVIEIRRLG